MSNLTKYYKTILKSISDDEEAQHLLNAVKYNYGVWQKYSTPENTSNLEGAYSVWNTYMIANYPDLYFPPKFELW